MVQIQECMFVCNLLEEQGMGTPGNDSKRLSGYYKNNEQTTGHEIYFSQIPLTWVLLRFYLTQHADLARTALKLATPLLSLVELLSYDKKVLLKMLTYNYWFFQQLLKLLTCYHAMPWKLTERADWILWKRFWKLSVTFKTYDISSAGSLSCRRLTAHCKCSALEQSEDHPTVRTN